MTKAPQFSVQADLYHFPYHYLPTLDDRGTIGIHTDALMGAGLYDLYELCTAIDRRASASRVVA